MHVDSPILHGQLKEEKIIPITLIVWALGRVEKCFKKGQQNFKQISKCDTCFYVHFSRAFQKKFFRSVALVTNFELI